MEQNKAITKLMNEISERFINFKFSDSKSSLKQIQDLINDLPYELEIISLKKKKIFIIKLEESNGYVSKKFIIE